jgi:hypothetical protein
MGVCVMGDSLATIRRDDEGPFRVQCVNCGVGFDVRSRFSTRWWCGPRCKRADVGDGEV